MKKVYIVTGTVTYAIKGRDLLKHYGIKAEVNKISGVSYGCGYAIAVYPPIESAVNILRENGIKILDVTTR